MSAFGTMIWVENRNMVLYFYFLCDIVLKQNIINRIHQWNYMTILRVCQDRLVFDLHLIIKGGDTILKKKNVTGSFLVSMKNLLNFCYPSINP
jgi:hypothetical protein